MRSEELEGEAASLPCRELTMMCPWRVQGDFWRPRRSSGGRSNWELSEEVAAQGFSRRITIMQMRSGDLDDYFGVLHRIGKRGS